MPSKERKPEDGNELDTLAFPDLLESGSPQNGVTGPLEDTAGPDPFDPATLRLPEDLNIALGAKRALLLLPVRKPSREWFVRVIPDPSYHLLTRVIELKDANRETFLVARSLWPELEAEATFTPMWFFLAVNRQQTPFLWSVKPPTPDGRASAWATSALEAVQLAQHRWVRVVPDMGMGGYSVWHATHDATPVWPDLRMPALLRLAFRERYIESLDHPVLKQLRGEV